MAKWQECSTDGCINRSAYNTTSKPAWCSQCLEAILRDMGLDAVEPFPGRNARWLTRCQTCQAERSYLLNYLFDLRTRKNEPACRRCFWIDWSLHAALMSGNMDTVGIQDQAEHLEGSNYAPVEPLFVLPRPGYPIITRCRSCGRQDAQRMGDIGWGCTCRANPSSGAKKSPGAAKKKDLLIESGHPALARWDAEVNDVHDLNTATVLANRHVAWICPKCGHHFTGSIRSVTQWLKCPKCEEKARHERAQERAVQNVTPVGSIPELVQAWADEADPDFVMLGDNQLRKFECPKGHHPRVTPSLYSRSGCPSCRGALARASTKPLLADVLSEIAGQWHPTKNGKWTPEKVGPDSKRFVWRKAACCGAEWQEEVLQRNKRPRYLCPECDTILDSLAWSDPGMAAEWSPENPATAWQVRPAGGTPFVPAWVCAVDPRHQWQASLAFRYAGSDCPECRLVGKSKIELEHFVAAEAQFGYARSGSKLMDKAFTLRNQWTADILVETRGLQIAIEYDGSHWHSPDAKQLVDISKSRDLLAAGYLVARLREDDLPSLEIEDAGDLELQVYSVAPRTEAVLKEIAQWVAAHPTI